MNAIQMQKTGGPEVLELRDVSRPEPGAGEVLVRVEAVGVNFIDIYRREGVYKVALPHIPGTEVAGVVEAVGEGVGLQPGDRVAGAAFEGAYAEYAVSPAEKVVKLPEGVTGEQAAAVMLQGMTAHYLAYDVYPLQPGDTCLIHAAAGGVGLLLTQMAKRLGARVIGTVSTEEKERLARAAGADEVIRYTEADFEAAVRELTGAEGVAVVYDSVGKTTFDKSLNCLRPRGMMALFGQSSGVVPPFDLQTLNAKGGLFITRPSLAHYTATREELERRAGDVLEWVAAGELTVRVDSSHPLADAAEAHRRLEGRETTGKVLLTP